MRGHTRAVRRAAIALAVTGMALRPQLVAIGPLADSIQSSLGASHAAVGLLSTVPLLCMGLFAPLAAGLNGRLGSYRALSFAVGLIVAGGFLRLATDGIGAMLVATIPIGIGIGMGNALMAFVVKEQNTTRPVFLTSFYTAGMQVGSTLATILAIPIADALGGFRGALLVFAVANAVSLVWWIALGPRARDIERGSMPLLPRLPWRNLTVWAAVLMMASIGAVYYGLAAWLADALVENGWTPARAGTAVGVMNAAAILGSAISSVGGDRFGSRRLWICTSLALMATACSAIIVAPDLAFAWAAMSGIGNGIAFAFLMTLPLDMAETSEDVGNIAGLLLGAGYSLIAVAPFVLGAVRDASTSFTVPFLVLVATALAGIVVAWQLTPERLHRGAPRPV